MTTEKQINANRLNAQKSTGPRTPQGKVRSAQNALKHGLTAEKMVLHDEDPEEYARFSQEMFDELKPAGILETFLARRIADQAWRLLRAERMETCMLSAMKDKFLAAASIRNPQSLPEGHDLLGQWVSQDLANSNRLLKIQQYEGRIERGFHRAIREFRMLRKQKNMQNEPNPQKPKMRGSSANQESYDSPASTEGSFRHQNEPNSGPAPMKVSHPKNNQSSINNNQFRGWRPPHTSAVDGSPDNTSRCQMPPNQPNPKKHKTICKRY